MLKHYKIEVIKPETLRRETLIKAYKQIQTLNAAYKSIRGVEASNINDVLSSVRNAVKSIRRELSVEYPTTRIVTHVKTGIAFKGRDVSLKDALNQVKERVKVRRAELKHTRIETNYISGEMPYKVIRMYSKFNAFSSSAVVHTEPGFAIKALKYRKTREVFDQKSPKDDSLHVGVEIEFCSKADRAELGSALFDAGLSEYVTLKGDGSVRPNSGDNAHELCVVAPQAQVKDVLAKACSVLSQAKAYVNKTTGLHVHLDMRTRDAATCYNNLMAAQNVLYSMLPKSRKDNSYCKPSRGRSWDAARRKSGRYYGINPASYRRHGTIEVRMHSGTVDATKISQWVSILIGIADAPKLGVIRSASTLITKSGLQRDTAAYIQDRIALFESQHAGQTQSETETEVNAA